MNWRTVSVVTGVLAVVSFVTVRKIQRDKDVEASLLDELDSLFFVDDSPEEMTFSVGDDVFIRDPIPDTYGHLTIRRGKIAEIRPAKDAHVDVIRLEGDSTWYNENWVGRDETGPETFQPVADVSERVDDLLDVLSDAKRMGNEEGAKRATEELRRLGGK